MIFLKKLIKNNCILSFTQRQLILLIFLLLISSLYLAIITWTFYIIPQVLFTYHIECKYDKHYKSMCLLYGDSFIGKIERAFDFQEIIASKPKRLIHPISILKIIINNKNIYLLDTQNDISDDEVEQHENIDPISLIYEINEHPMNLEGLSKMNSSIIYMSIYFLLFATIILRGIYATWNEKN